MMKSGLAVILLHVFIAAHGQYRHRDSLSYHADFSLLPKKNQRWNSPLVNAIKAPVILTAMSLYAMTDNENFSRVEVKEERDEWAPHFHHKSDNYLQFAPIVAVYGLNMAGVKGKNDFRNRTALLLKSELLVAAITFPLKKLTAEPRPDTGTPNSFPSGHTAQAFAAATFMAKEYGHRSVWYSVGAYSLATCVGAMRVLNDRHWASDVLAGAAVGILSTNLVYLTHHQKTSSKKNKHQTLVVPSYDGQSVTITFVRTLE
jgi:membrane-associated phospholipid phosphatase